MLGNIIVIDDKKDSRCFTSSMHARSEASWFHNGFFSNITFCFQGFKETKHMVFARFYLVDGSYFDDLNIAF